MFDINIKNVKRGKRFFYIFLLAGILILLILVGIFIANIIVLNNLDSTILSKKVEVTSYMDDEGSIMYRPVYYYEVDGQNYSCGSNASSSHNPGTENKNVYYDSKNPSNCMTEFSKSGIYIILVFLILPITFILVGGINIRKINKRIKAILELNKKGKLIKNLPYRLVDTNVIVNNIPLQKPVIDYTLASGTIITLYGDTRHDKKHWDADGMVDLLIDESNPDNYYIDFEINRLSGNLPEDYYKQQKTSSADNDNKNI